MCRVARRGKDFAIRTSCATLRIFSANGSRASCWRISSFISWAISVYAFAARFPNRFCQFGLLEQLLNVRLVLRAPHSGGDGHDVFRAKNFGWHAFVINSFRFTHGFLGQAAEGKKLDRESAHQKVLALDLPALGLQMAGMPAVRFSLFGMKKMSAS